MLEDNGFREAKPNSLDATLFWYNTSIKPHQYQALNKYQRVNHFPKSKEVTRKDLLSINMNRMSSLFPQHYDFYPKTFSLPAENAICTEEIEANPGLWWI